MSAEAPALPRVGFVSLGCPKALVDSERILTQLRLDGYEVVPDYEAADVVVVNTCGFIDSARAESLEAIGEALRENGQVIVTGCLGVHEDQIRAAHPGVLSVTGPQQYEQVVGAVHAHVPPPPKNPFVDLVPPQGVKLTPRHYAYLKIAEGCNHKCSFCIIPSMRGGLASRALDDVMAEAERLVRAGVRELLVISQDTSAWGLDRRYAPSLWRDRERPGDIYHLAEALGELGVWIRLHYVYPYPHVDALIPLMRDGLVLPYLDIPFQHASPAVLKRMRRPAAAEDNLRRIQAWRAICPDMAIRSTFIVGFPGETDADFQQLLDFLEAAELDRVGCFEYSPVAGAAANALADAVPAEVAAERWERFMQTQQTISRRKLARRIGQRMTVLVDAVNGDQAEARSYADAPEIDGLVHVSGVTGVGPGQFIDVVVEDAEDYDLFAVPSAAEPG